MRYGLSAFMSIGIIKNHMTLAIDTSVFHRFVTWPKKVGRVGQHMTKKLLGQTAPFHKLDFFRAQGDKQCQRETDHEVDHTDKGHAQDRDEKNRPIPLIGRYVK